MFVCKGGDWFGKKLGDFVSFRDFCLGFLRVFYGFSRWLLFFWFAF